MMEKFVILLLASSLFFSCSKEKESNLHISGEVKGLREGRLFLQKVQDDTLLVNLDSLQIDGDPHFDFYTYLESPEILFLYLDKKDGQTNDDIIKFFAESGEMQIHTSLKNFENVIIHGSENQKKLEEYETNMQKFNDRNMELVQKNFEANKTDNQDNA